jgi:hypothetical protein
MFTPRPHNGLGITGFVLGLIGFLLAPIPMLGMIALPVVLPGLVFSCGGLARATRRERGIASAGVALSLLGLAVVGMT